MLGVVFFLAALTNRAVFNLALQPLAIATAALTAALAFFYPSLLAVHFVIGRRKKRSDLV